MLRPDQEQSRIKISDMFVNKYSTDNSAAAEEDVSRRIGQLILTRSDPIWISGAFLDRIILDYVLKHRITKEYFDEKHLDYAIRVLGMAPAKTSSDKSNLLKALKHGNISPNKFAEFFNIMGLEPREISMRFIPKRGGKPVDIKIDNTKQKQS